MAKIELSERERMVLYQHLRDVPIGTRLERKSTHRLWEALNFEPLIMRNQASLSGVRWAELSTEPREYELTSDQRDYLIEWLDPAKKAQIADMSRMLLPLADRLEKSRDGEPT